MDSLKKLFNRKIINDPKLQYGISIFFVSFGLVNFIFFIVVLKVCESKLVSEINTLDSATSRYLNQIIIEISNLLFNILSLFGIFTLSISFVAGILLLQHISGPVFAFKKFLSDVLEGKPSRYPLHLRNHDFFSDLADLVNKIYEKFELDKKNDPNLKK